MAGKRRSHEATSMLAVIPPWSSISSMTFCPANGDPLSGRRETVISLGRNSTPAVGRAQAAVIRVTTTGSAATSPDGSRSSGSRAQGRAPVGHDAGGDDSA